MSGLKNLLALQQKAKAVETAKPAEPVAEPAATPKKLGGLALLAKKAQSGLTPSVPSSPKPAPEPAPKPAPELVESLDTSAFSLEDLADLDVSAIAVDDSDTTAGSSKVFLDEIEATAPDRDLTDLESGQLIFLEQLDSIYSLLHDPEMFGQVVSSVMIELQTNKEYIRLIQDQDVHVMIHGMRNTMGLAKIKKQAKSRKASTTAKAKKTGVSGVSDADLAALDGILGDL